MGHGREVWGGSEKEPFGGGVGPGGVNLDALAHGEGAKLVGDEACLAGAVVTAAGPWGDDMVEHLIEGPKPGLGTADGALGVFLVGKLFLMLEDQEGRLVGEELELAQRADDADGFRVVVFVLDVEGWRGGVDDDQAGLVVDDGLAHGGFPAAGQGVVFEPQHGVQVGGVGATVPSPGPLVVAEEVGFAVFFIEVKDTGGDGDVAEEWGTHGEGIGQHVAESALARACFPGENDHRPAGQHVADDPAGLNGSPREDRRGFH